MAPKRPGINIDMQHHADLVTQKVVFVRDLVDAWDRGGAGKEIADSKIL